MNGSSDQAIEYVTATVGSQLFGIPIAQVHDVFQPEQITPVPLAHPAVAGLLNLRGRVVTAIDMRRRLELPPRSDEGKSMAIGIDRNGESYGLLVDAVGEMIELGTAGRESNPVNLDAGWRKMADGVHSVGDRLMVILDVDRVLELQAETLNS